MTAPPRVTVWMPTFNHADYIERAVRSVFAQRTAFPVELVVHDDASVDGTAERVEALAAAAPLPVRLVRQRQNQYSLGKRPIDFFDGERSAEFVALLEADDQWTDPHKLQRQVQALDAQPGMDICFHQARSVVANGSSTLIGTYGPTERVVPLIELLSKRHGEIPTASLLVRKVVLEQLKAFRLQHAASIGDAYVLFFGARRGGAIYLPVGMADYNKELPGSWSANHRDPATQLAHFEQRIIGLGALDRFTSGEHRQALCVARRHWMRKLLWSEYSHRHQRRAFLKALDAMCPVERIIGHALAASAPTASAARQVVRAVRRLRRK